MSGLAAILALTVAGCGGPGPAASPPTNAQPGAPPDAPTTSTATPPTAQASTSAGPVTVVTLPPVPVGPAPTITATGGGALPAAPQVTAAAAASSLIDSWKAGDRDLALRVASGPAVATLFATRYAGQVVVDRGCSEQFPPLVCSYGPGGGSSGSLYQLYVSPTGADWYVSSVTIEG